MNCYKYLPHLATHFSRSSHGCLAPISRSRLLNGCSSVKLSMQTLIFGKDITAASSSSSSSRRRLSWYSTTPPIMLGTPRIGLLFSGRAWEQDSIRRLCSESSESGSSESDYLNYIQGSRHNTFHIPVSRCKQETC